MKSERKDKMFLEVIRDVRNNKIKNFTLVSVDEMIIKHPYCLDLKCWAKGNRLNSRFGLSNNKGRFTYIRTNEKDNNKLEAMARNA